MNIYLAALEIDIQLSNGNKTRFIQRNVDIANELVGHLHPERLFAQKQLILAGDHSLSVYPSASVERVDFVQESFPLWAYPHSITEIFEIPESEFLARYDLSTSRGQRKFHPGEPFSIFGELELSSGQHIFREIHILIPHSEPSEERLPLDRNVTFQQLFQTPSLHLRRCGGGVIVINPRHLVRMTFYPGPTEIPANTWLAESQGHLWQ